MGVQAGVVGKGGERRLTASRTRDMGNWFDWKRLAQAAHRW